MLKEKIVMGVVIGLFLMSLGINVSTDKKPSLGNQTGGRYLTSSKDGIAIIDLNGPIQLSSRALVLPGSPDHVIELLKSYETVSQVKGIVLRVNSPGGSVGSSQEVFNAIQLYKKQTGNPVVVSVIDYAASGAYWISLAGTKIVANTGSLVGSMGVITQTPDLTKVKEKYGVGMRTFKSVEMKDILNPWRATTKRERIIVNRMLDNLHKQFVLTIVKSRGLEKKVADTLADGRLYTGEQALKLGLVDQLGGFEESVNLAGSLAGLKGRPHLIYQKPSGFQQLFGSIKSSLNIPFLNKGMVGAY